MTNQIAIIRLSALGDILHTIPSVQVLIRNLSEYEITWFVEKGNEKLLECFKAFVNIQTVSLKGKGFYKIIKEIFRIRKEFKGKFDLIIDFQGLIKSSILALILGKKRVGFNRINIREKLASFFYTEKIIPIDNDIHIIFKNIKLAENILNTFFKIKSVDKNFNYPVIKTCKSDKLNNFYKKNNLKEFILLNIGGGWETKILKEKQYEEIINSLKKEYKIIILWGNNKEQITAKKLSKKTGCLTVDFLNFKELFSIIGSSEFIITSDTLALHIADIVKTRSIGIFGPTSPNKNGSINDTNPVVYKKLKCSPCHKRKCSNLKCMDNIKSDDILYAVKLLK
jgi:heptosyltransferase-1